LPLLNAEFLLEKAALDHTADLSKNNLTGHDGSDGSTTRDRIERYCQWFGRMGENICLGASMARDIVIQLVVDDGVPDRGHRKNICNPGNQFSYKFSIMVN